jgi:hypothetical protein
MANKLEIVSMVYKIDLWSSFEKVKTQMEDLLGPTIFTKTVLSEPKSGYVEIKAAPGCENRIKETIRQQLPLTEYAPIYSDGKQLFSEFYFTK